MQHSHLTTGLIAVLFATSAMAANDDFNRAKLGNRWISVSGSQSISNHMFVGDPLSLGYYKKSSEDTTVSALVDLTSTDVEYGAVASGNIAGGDNAFVKLQSQSGDGKFTNGGFYTGDNVAGQFFALNAEVPSPATITVSFCGAVATMKIKSAARTQTYSYDYGQSFGTGGGLGTFGAVALDNFASKPGGCALQDRGVWIRKGSGKAFDPTLPK
jgi:hypothetical protein